MAIDPTIRTRLLAMPREFANATTAILEHQGELSYAREQREQRQAVLVEGLIAGWQETKSNETIRKAQTEAILAADTPYRDFDRAAQDAERGIKRWQMRLDDLRFELSCLLGIANN